VPEIETDYLVIGAGTSGMAFVDELIAHRDVDVVMIDRRHDPGGHWNDAYPFVRLHQPAATYGVSSTPLGRETIDASGPNQGFYERANGSEIVAYYREVLDDVLLASGRVRFYGGADYTGDWSSRHVFVSGLTGTTTTVRVRRALVDATFLETSVPATHTPSFAIDDGARCIPVGRLVDVDDGPDEFVILGAGKTAMDAASWLLDNGVDPGDVRWVRPRDAWLTPRACFQPLDLVAGSFVRLASAVEAIATASDVDDLFHRLEDGGQMLRLDPSVWPSMYRGPMVSDAEHRALTSIERVVRLGRVRRVGDDRIVLEDGEVPAAGAVMVDCTAYGFRGGATRPMFEPGRITPQSVMGGFTSFNAALVAYVEATRDDLDEKNRLCVPSSLPNRPIDWVRSYRGGLLANALHSAEPDLAAWIDGCRLNNLRGLSGAFADPAMGPALATMGDHLDIALANADRLLAAEGALPPSR
jgi:hypothetical protein